MKIILFFILLLPLVSIAQTHAITSINIDSVMYKRLQVGVKPDFLATDDDNAWVIDDHQNRIIKISSKSDMPLLIVHVANACTAPVVRFGSLWVMSCSEKKLYRINTNNGAIQAKIATGMADESGEMSIAVGNGSVWLLSDSSGVITRINPLTNTIQKKIIVKAHSYCAAFGNKAIWVTNYLNNSVQKINPATNLVTATIAVGIKPRFITVGESGVWTLNQGDGTVSRIDPLLNKTIATIDVKAIGNGGDISADKNKVWVVSTNTQRPVQTINTASNAVETIYLQNPPKDAVFKVDGGVRISKNFVWVSGYHSKTVWVLKR